MNIKAAIFDLDGTLLDTLPDLADAMNWTLTQEGYPACDIAHHRGAIGRGTREYVKGCLPLEVKDDEALLNRATERMRAHYGENWNHKTRPYHGIIALLDDLTQRGILRCVVTNKMHTVAVALIQRWFGAYGFDPVYGDRPGKPPKPDPTVALEAAAELGVVPSEVVFIGDSKYDMLTAQHAGMHGIGVTWGYGTRAELIESGAAFLADTPADVIAHIQSLL